MPKNKELKLDLPSVDELFTTQAERDEALCEVIKNLPLLMDYFHKKFKKYTGTSPVEYRKQLFGEHG